MTANHKFFDTEPMDTAKVNNAASKELCLHAPATQRNKEVILQVLKDHLPKQGTILEIASGTGQHACHFAHNLPDITWQPTDIDDRHLNSINSWAQHMKVSNVTYARYLNVLESWPALDHITAICAINLLHIAPWSVTKALFKQAAKCCVAAKTIFLYGPYKQNDQHTSESNRAFDQSLKAQNNTWGIRDMEAVVEEAMQAGFNLHKAIPMPANNFSLIFRK